MSDTKKVHFLYCDKLKNIGVKLGFKTKWENNEAEKELYHLADPDCIWYQEMPDSLRENRYEGIPPMLPLIVFEVLYSEQAKSMRGSLGSFLIRGAYLGVFVVLKPKNQSEDDYNDRIEYLKKMIKRIGFGRFAVWKQDAVDELGKSVNTLSAERLRSRFKNKYSMAVGENLLEQIKRKVDELLNTKIGISGRSYKKGKEITINIPVKDIL